MTVDVGFLRLIHDFLTDLERFQFMQQRFVDMYDELSEQGLNDVRMMLQSERHFLLVDQMIQRNQQQQP